MDTLAAVVVAVIAKVVVFYLWMLHPVAHLSNWFLMIPSIATKFQQVNSPRGGRDM
jgi:hypothetical protein